MKNEILKKGDKLGGIKNHDKYEQSMRKNLRSSKSTNID